MHIEQVLRTHHTHIRHACEQCYRALANDALKQQASGKHFTKEQLDEYERLQNEYRNILNYLECLENSLN
jgi:hypothetical protein